MKKIVFIGGGGGITNIAPGLRDDFDVTAIMTTFDDGGSTGRLKKNYQMPAVGDLRRAFAALSTNSHPEFLNARFEKGRTRGHALGNLIITAAFQEFGDYKQALDYLHDFFSIKGRVLPSSVDMSVLHARFADGTVIAGEHNLDEPHAKSDQAIMEFWLDPIPTAFPGVKEAIEVAEMLIFGPGDVYGSCIPNLLVDGVKEALKASKAKKVFFCNLFTKYGQTNGFTASDHVRTIEKYCDDKFDAVVLCSSKVPEEVVRFHQQDHEKLVDQDLDKLSKQGYDVLSRDLLDPKIHQKLGADVLKRSMIFNSPSKVFKVICEIMGQ